MNDLNSLEKKINSELASKIKNSKINHSQLYLTISSEDLIDVVLFLKTSIDFKFKQLIELTAVDYPEKKKRFMMDYIFLSH